MARNPNSTAMAHAGPRAAKTLSRAKTMAKNASATVAADARMTRPMLAVAWMMA